MSEIILSYIARDAGSDRNYSIVGHAGVVPSDKEAYDAAIADKVISRYLCKKIMKSPMASYDFVKAKMLITLPNVMLCNIMRR